MEKRMPVSDQIITDDYAIYNGDCVDVISDMPPEFVDMSVYSPPFAGLFQYSGDERDMSNCYSYDEFYRQYAFLIQQMYRVTKPGRINCVHCMDIGEDAIGTSHDLPGRIIRLHEEAGWKYMGRRLKWNEPLSVRLRTMVRGLAHATICEDSTKSSIAHADYILFFRKPGENKVAVTHERGFTRYFGEEQMPQSIREFRGFNGDQKENKFSHFVWRRYASSAWMDIRASNSQECGDGLKARAVVDDGEAREPDDVKHVHPLMLDIIHRCVELYTNPGETVLTPFMGVGSEVYSPVYLGRRGIGIELKASYFRQAAKNIAKAKYDFSEDISGDVFNKVEAAE
jgi:DNA modification methylase